MGKTRLARRVADEVRRRFPGGVWLVELSGLDCGELLARTVLDALRVDDRSARQPRRVLADHLRNKRLLLVLDNCEHLVDACATLVTELLKAAPRLRVLVSSRQTLGANGEHVLTVPPLSLPQEVPGTLPSGTGAEAVELFALLAASVRSDFLVHTGNQSTVAAICRQVEGIPLAIELAAARLRTLSLSLSLQIAVRLDRCLALLTETGPSTKRAAPNRTLRATLQWSYDLCSPDEQRLWARMSVIRGGFDLETAEACSDHDGARPTRSVLDLIARLVDKSILTRDEHDGQARFRMLETIRQYGQERLALSTPVANQHSSMSATPEFCLTHPSETQAAL